MPYKSKDKAKEATRARVRRYRDKNVTPSDDVTPSLMGDDVTPAKNVTPDVTPYTVPKLAKEILSQEIIGKVLTVLYDRRALGLEDDSVARWDRAITYKQGAM